MLSQQCNMKIVGCKIQHNPKLTILKVPSSNFLHFLSSQAEKNPKFPTKPNKNSYTKFLKKLFSLVWHALGANMQSFLEILGNLCVSSLDFEQRPATVQIWNSFCHFLLVLFPRLFESR